MFDEHHATNIAKLHLERSEEPSMDILTGTDAERTHFAFGAADKWSVSARVTGIRPRSNQVEITAVIEDDRVHQN